MIKGNKKPVETAQEVDQDLDQDPQDDVQESEPSTPSTLSGHQEVDNRATLKALFAEYEEAEKTVSQAKQGVEDALGERSAVLQKILDLSGSGPYKVDGQMVKIVKRGTTLFVRGKGKEEAIEV